MEHSDRLKRNARRWRVTGTLAFLVGAFLIWGRVSYNLHDFFAENYSRPTKSELFFYSVEDTSSRLGNALDKMEAGEYWEAVTDLDLVKNSGGPSIQFAEWYKILCMIGLDEKERAISLLEYYIEQPDFPWKRTEAELLLKDY